jgi:hypothetical protein
VPALADPSCRTSILARTYALISELIQAQEELGKAQKGSAGSQDVGE